MGDEIATDRFTETDVQRFHKTLQQETDLLRRWCKDGQFDEEHYRVGFELETWLIDLDCHPLPHNEVYLERMNSPLCLPELSRFIVEFNTEPVDLGDGMFDTLQQQLAEIWRDANTVADSMDLQLGMIGILPTVQEHDLTLDRMSLMNRYRALNERVMEMRKGCPLQIDIRGRDHLRSLHEDVMLESACTSFQVHVQVPQSRSVEAYNASLVLSPITVAVSCNAPFLFGMDLWEETRIPLFEQSVSLGNLSSRDDRQIGRVSCGSGYAGESLMEFFDENLAAFPVILPLPYSNPAEEFRHLRLHNGTIWRWTRPLMGLDTPTPHLRIEHRVMPAGPTQVDMIANTAFFLGMLMAILENGEDLVSKIPFEQARENFYRAAQSGLDSRVTWCGGQEYLMRDLLLQEMLPMARSGLRASGLASAEADRYLDIIEQRVTRRMTGARWMRAWHYAHDGNVQSLVGAYLKRQQEGRPVHEWML